MVGKILAWVKANLLIVISGVLIVVLPAVGWYFSSSWNKSIKTQAEEAHRSAKQSLTRASTVTYTLPAVLEGEEDLSETRAPNSVVTEFYKAQKAERDAQVAEVVERGTAFNQREHRVPIEGMLPDPGDRRELGRIAREMRDRLGGTPERPSMFQAMLRRLNAGDAPDPEILTSSLEQYKMQREQELAASSPNGQLSTEQREQIDQELVQKRLSEYASRAESLSFYAAPHAVLMGGPEAGSSFIPGPQAQVDFISPVTLFRWTWDSWVINDILEAVSRANTDPSGVSLSIPDAPIKRVELIRVSDLAVSEADAGAMQDDPGSRNPRDRRSSSSSDDVESAVLSASYTGRQGGTPGSAYDIRTVDLVVVASSERLPALFDALGRTNYMTVVDLGIEPVDPWEAIERGYFYGDEHVVRAVLTIETVWLRSWTTGLMPDQVKQAFGVPILENTGG